MRRKEWFGTFSPGIQSIEEAIAFYVDEEDDPKVRMFDTLAEAQQEAADCENPDLKFFKVTFEELDI